jgi:replication-associated recombination protein RarA
MMLTPDDIRKMYRDEPEATDDEARETAKEARTDPAQARRLLLTLYALAGEEREFDQLLQLVIKVGAMQLLVQASEADDRFALQMAELILDGMETMAKVASRTVQRGRQSAKKARTA